MTTSLISKNVINTLVSNNRSERGKTFGIGLVVSEGETPEQVIAKCRAYIARYETYIANLNVVINSGEELASEMRKAKASNFISSLSEAERESLKGLLE